MSVTAIREETNICINHVHKSLYVHRCYDSAGSSNDKSLGGTWAILGDDAKLCRPNVVLGEVFGT